MWARPAARMMFPIAPRVSNDGKEGFAKLPAQAANDNLRGAFAPDERMRGARAVCSVGIDPEKARGEEFAI